LPQTTGCDGWGDAADGAGPPVEVLGAVLKVKEVLRRKSNYPV